MLVSTSLVVWTPSLAVNSLLLQIQLMVGFGLPSTTTSIVMDSSFWRGWKGSGTLTKTGPPVFNKV